MNEPEDSSLADCCAFLALDDACLAAVLGGLSARQLRAAAAVCKRLSAISQANSLWIKHIRDEFGLCISSEKGAQQVPGAALKLYSRLRQAKQQPYALPAQALCTDGGCDEPFDTYWAGNMFSSKRTLLYCSEANTSNISVFARLCPPAGSSSLGSSTHQALQQQQHPGTVALQEQGGMQGQQQQGGAQQQQQEAAQGREFLLGRCAQAARHLINQRVVDRYGLRLKAQQEQEQQQQMQQGVSSRMSWLMGLVARRFGTLDKKGAVTAALQTCSTEGLADFFITAYMGQQQDASWARSLFSNLGDNEIQHVHELAFAVWSQMMHTPTRHRFLLLPMPQPPTLLPSKAAQPAVQAASSAAVAGLSSSSSRAHVPAAGGASLQQQQQQRRRLLCAEDQLQALCSMTTPVRDTSIVQECVLARDGLSGSTCPIRSGFIFLGHYQAPTAGNTKQLLTTSSSSSVAAAPARPAGEDAACAAAAGEAASTDVKALVADLGSLASQPWPAAAHDLTSAAAVHVASTAGLLPPVTDYATTGSAEYIEFAAPSQEQLMQQRQEWAALCGSVAGSSCSSSGGMQGAGAWPAGGWVAPVLWFRFADAIRGNDDDDEVAEAAGLEAVEAVEGSDEEEEQHGEPGLDSSSSMSTEEEEAAEAGDRMSTDGSNQDAGQPQQQQPHHGASAGEGAIAEEQQQSLLQAAVAAAAVAQQAVSSPADGAGGTGTAAAAAPTPRIVASSPSTGNPAPELPIAATEVAAALGWLPTGAHAGMLAVQLQQPRSANIVCVLLLDCEDVKPAFNRSRGGCNIDMQLVMLRGHAVGQLPHGLQVASPGQWCFS